MYGGKKSGGKVESPDTPAGMLECSPMPKPRQADQLKLIDFPAQFKNGLVYRPNFITAKEEAELIKTIEWLPLRNAKFGEYTAKRRSMAFGWWYDHDKEKFVPGSPLPDFLIPLTRKVAKWLDIPNKRVVEALINEYTPGTPIGWHTDREKFEHVVGVSLAGWCTIRFRPYATQAKKDTLSLELEPRSAYIMQKDVRWKWQHSVPPTKTLRYSITFRTLPETK